MAVEQLINIQNAKLSLNAASQHGGGAIARHNALILDGCCPYDTKQ